MGMALMTRAAAGMGICGEQETERIESILKKYHLPVRTEYCASELASIAKNDKKIAAGSINVVLPRKMGDCFLYNIDTDALEGVFARGLA